MQFKCNENYTLIGKSKMTCQGNKKWEADIPKCLGKSVFLLKLVIITGVIVIIRILIAKFSLTQLQMCTIFSVF